MSDAYLRSLLAREAVDTSIFSPLRQVQTALAPAVAAWANGNLLSMAPSGSFSKGTANRSGTDIDLFLSLREDVSNTLAEIYQALFNQMQQAGFRPRKQNVSIGVKVGEYDVDLVPGKRQNALTLDHSLYRNKADTWTKTNVSLHIDFVSSSFRQNEIRLLKLWRNQKGLEFPSFYLELTVINALRQPFLGTLAQNVVRCLEYLRDSFERARVVDPANGANIISDDLTAAEKQAVKSAAIRALAGSWEAFVR